MSGNVCFLYAGYYRRPEPVPEHLHYGTELVYVVRGSCVNSIEGQQLLCREGDICLIPAELRHARQENSADLHTQYVVFNDSGLERQRLPPDRGKGRAVRLICRECSGAECGFACCESA